jgi:hypothetical protein
VRSVGRTVPLTSARERPDSVWTGDGFRVRLRLALVALQPLGHLSLQPGTRQDCDAGIGYSQSAP